MSTLLNNTETFISGPDGKLEAKYAQSKKENAPLVVILHPHPEYGGTMNNRVVNSVFNTFVKNNFSVLKFNFRGVGKSEGKFDNGLGELADAASALDFIQRNNQNSNESWIVGYSFGSFIGMQLLMRRPEIFRFVSIAPQPNIFDFNFLAPCPTSGLIVYGTEDQLVPIDSIKTLKAKLLAQKNITVEFDEIKNCNHFFLNHEKTLIQILEKYLRKESRLF
jgi:alpha/beta superfamily hydrolase